MNVAELQRHHPRSERFVARQIFLLKAEGFDERDIILRFGLSSSQVGAIFRAEVDRMWSVIDARLGRPKPIRPLLDHLPAFVLAKLLVATTEELSNIAAIGGRAALLAFLDCARVRELDLGVKRVERLADTLLANIEAAPPLRWVGFPDLQMTLRSPKPRFRVRAGSRAA